MRTRDAVLQQVELCCPACRGDLTEAESPDHVLRCGRCNRQYPVILGIPDLRLFADPYIDMAADRAKGVRLAQRFDDFDLAGFINFYYENTSFVTAAQAQQFTQGLLSAPERAAVALGVWDKAIEGNYRRAKLLDLGCGTAPMLIAAAQRFDRVVGVDIAFRWLVVARKRLDEAGIDAPLVCACAEALPFHDAYFDCVTAESVIEHVRDQSQAMSEAFRVLRAPAPIFLATPNRYSLGPDPHIGLLGGSMLPKRWIAAYAHRVGAVPPERKLLSVAGLKQLLRRSGFRLRALLLPDIPASRRAQLPALMRRAVAAYQLVKRLPLTRQFLFMMGPLISAVAIKEADVTAQRP